MARITSGVRYGGAEKLGCLQDLERILVTFRLLGGNRGLAESAMQNNSLASVLHSRHSEVAETNRDRKETAPPNTSSFGASK